MSLNLAEDDSSEDEIFIGPITLKEIRARLIPKHVRRTMKYANNKKGMNESDSSVNIIEMHSEPEMDTEKNNLIDSPDLPPIRNKLDHCTKLTDISFLRLSPNDSFLRIEKQMAECVLENTNDDLNNLKVDNVCFNNLPLCEHNDLLESGDKPSGSLNNHNKDAAYLLQQHSNPTIQVQPEMTVKIRSNKKDNIKMEEIGTPPLNLCKILSTPKKATNNIDFKTTVSIRKQQASSIKKTHSKVNLYKHITSPVASYIKSPQIPIVRNVKREPQSVSLIPKLKKNSVVMKMSNKENIKLQSNTHQSPKRTEVVHDKGKLRQSNNGNSSMPYYKKKFETIDVTPRKLFDLQDEQFPSLVDLSLISEADESLQIKHS